MKTMISVSTAWSRYRSGEAEPGECISCTDAACRERHLAGGEVFSMKMARNDEIAISEGIVWLTHSNQPGDHILKQGDRFAARTSGTVILESLSYDAEIRIMQH